MARSLGAGRLRTFARITLGQARGAILGGCLLAALVILAEYGAFNILGFQTFTTEIYQDLQLPTEVPTACALSLVLVAISLVVLGGEARAGGRGRAARSGPMVPRLMPPLRLGAATIPALLGVALLVVLALGVPLGESIYLIVQGGTPSVTSSVSVSMLAAVWHTAGYGIAAGVIDTLLALPVAVLAIRHTGAARRFLERSTYLVLAMPGVVIALALTYFSEQYLNSAGYQTAPLLIICYVIMFFPLALVGVKAAIARAPGGPRRGGALARAAAAGRVQPGDHAPGRAGADSGVLPGFPVRRDRADRNAGAGADRRADAGHPVLAVPDGRLLLAGGSVRRCHDRHRGTAEHCAGPVLQPGKSGARIRA